VTASTVDAFFNLKSANCVCGRGSSQRYPDSLGGFIIQGGQDGKQKERKGGDGKRWEGQAGRKRERRRGRVRAEQSIRGGEKRAEAVKINNCSLKPLYKLIKRSKIIILSHYITICSLTIYMQRP